MVRAGAISGPVGASGDESPRRERAETRELPGARGRGAMGVGGGPHAAPAAPRETAGLETAGRVGSKPRRKTTRAAGSLRAANLPPQVPTRDRVNRLPVPTATAGQSTRRTAHHDSRSGTLGATRELMGGGTHENYRNDTYSIVYHN